MSGGNAPDIALSKQRSRLELQCGEPADTGPTAFEAQFATDDSDVDATTVENPNLAPSGHADEPLPGKFVVSGSRSGAMDADGSLPALGTAHRKISAQTDLGGGAYRHTYGRGEANDFPASYTTEFDQDDGIRMLHVGRRCTGYTLTVASGAPVLFAPTIEAAYASPWRTATERHPNPATGSLFVRGMPEEWLDRSEDSTTGAQTLSVTLVDKYVDSDGIERMVWMARNGQTRHIAGTWTVTIGTAAFTGSSGEATTDLVAGDIIVVEGEYMTVATVGGNDGTDDDAFTTTENHAAGAAAVRVVREYGEAAQAGLTFWTQRAGITSQTELPRWHSVEHSSGGFMGDRASAGTTVEAYLTASTGIVGGTAAVLPSGGTLAVTAGDATMTGTSTDFVADLKIGDLIITAAGVEKRVIKITSTTSLEADSDYDTSESTAAGTYRPTPRVSLTGTITTAGTTALTASGGAFLTELAVGSEVRTVGGEVNRVESISDNDTAVCVTAWSGSEAGVAGTVAYEWDVLRERASWSASAHTSGQFIENISAVHLFLSGTTIPEEQVEVGESVTFEWTSGMAAVQGIGRKWAATIGDQGQSSGTMTLVERKLSAQMRKAIYANEILRFRLVLSTGKLISASPFEYSWEAIGHVKLAGKPGFVPDVSNNETITGGLFGDASDVDGYTDALQWVVTSDRATPAATS